jgi:hypothetical protein
LPFNCYSKCTLPEPIAVVDLFAGPGGLVEDFSRFEEKKGLKVFEMVISLKKDPFVRQALRVRGFYRHYRNNRTRIPRILSFSLVGNFQRKAFHRSTVAWCAVFDQIEAGFLARVGDLYFKI